MAEPDLIVKGQHSNVGPGAIMYSTINNVLGYILTLAGCDDFNKIMMT